ncbi:MAG: hypothetical protein Q8933_20170, partial [Bacteroidota bacterium]|nr:hypothetical protein [Bacteroidota bacterium]
WRAGAKRGARKQGNARITVIIISQDKLLPSLFTEGWQEQLTALHSNNIDKTSSFACAQRRSGAAGAGGLAGSSGQTAGGRKAEAEERRAGKGTPLQQLYSL